MCNINHFYPKHPHPSLAHRIQILIINNYLFCRKAKGGRGNFYTGTRFDSGCACLLDIPSWGTPAYIFTACDHPPSHFPNLPPLFAAILCTYRFSRCIHPMPTRVVFYTNATSPKKEKKKNYLKNGERKSIAKLVCDSLSETEWRLLKNKVQKYKGNFSGKITKKKTRERE